MIPQLGTEPLAITLPVREHVHQGRAALHSPAVWVDKEAFLALSSP